MKTQKNKNGRAPPELHLLCGAGGSRAIFASVGAFIAFERLQLKFETFGGVSGGSIPALFLAAGMRLQSIINLSLDMEFSGLVVKKDEQSRWEVYSEMLSRRLSETLPHIGIYNSTNLGALVNSHAREWPASFWTVSRGDDAILAFTDSGVYRHPVNGLPCSLNDWEKICRKAADVGLAIRSTVAVPGLIDAVKSPYPGSKYLFDGAIGPEGACPISIPQSLFNTAKDLTVVVDVGPCETSASKNFARYWKVVCGSKCLAPDISLTSSDNVLVISPRITSVETFEFGADRDAKWQAIIEGYCTAIDALLDYGLVTPEEVADSTLLLDRDFELAFERYGRLPAFN